MTDIKESKTHQPDTPVAVGDIQIRLATPDDAPAILEMLRLLIQDSPMKHTNDWAGSGEAKSVVAFHIERDMALVAEVDGQVVGHIGWRIGYTRPPEAAFRYAEVESVFIHQDYRGQEVAKMLISGFLKECERKAISTARVNARPDDATISLFESCGFAEQRRLLVRTGGGDDGSGPAGNG